MYFNNPENLQELRTQYKKLCFEFHPDVSGFDSLSIMKIINSEYSDLTKQLASGLKFEQSEIEFSDLYREKIESLLNLQGIFIELIGNWLWISGNTKEHKDKLKELKFRFAPKKKAWYFKNYAYTKKTGEKSTLEEIRNLYGSQTINKEEKTLLLFN